MMKPSEMYLKEYIQHMMYVRRADRNENAYFGRTDDGLVGANLIVPVVNAMLGAYLREQADVVLRGYDGTDIDHARAQLLSAVLNYAADRGGYHDAEFDAVRNGLILSRGFLDIRIDVTDNLLGDIKVVSLDPREVILPSAGKSADPKTWPYVLIARWVTFEEVEGLFGEDVRRMVEGRGSVLQRPHATQMFYSDSYGAGHYRTGVPMAPPENTVLMIECQHRMMDRVEEFVDLATGDIYPVPSTWSREQIEQTAERLGLGIRKAMRQRVKHMIEVADVMVYEDWSPYPDFTIVPFFPFAMSGRTAGVVDHLVEPNRLLNEADEAILNILKNTANSGWLLEQGSLANMTSDELQERGSDDIVIEYRRGRQPPEKIKPNSIPTGYEQFSRKFHSYVTEISGVQSLLGLLPTSEVSGVSLSRAQNGAQLQIAPILYSLRQTRYRAFKFMLDLVQQYYTQQRSIRIVGQDEESQTIILNADPVTDVTVGKYDVVVAEAPRRDARDEQEFAKTLEMVQAGVPIPPEYIVEVSPLRKRREIAELIKRMGGRGDPSDQEAQLAQIMQQMELQRAQAELAKLQGEVMELQARATLQMAKAEKEAANPQIEMAKMQSTMQGEIARLQTELAKKRADLENKLQLAEMHIGAKAALQSQKALLDKAKIETGLAAEMMRMMNDVGRTEGRDD